MTEILHDSASAMRRRTSFPALLLALIGSALSTTLPWAQAVPSGSEFQVDTYSHTGIKSPQIARSDSGDFVVVWEDSGSNADSVIAAQRFDNAGNKLGPEFQVNTYTKGYPQSPAVTMDRAGDFIVVWHFLDLDPFDLRIDGQRFDEGGNRIGLEFEVAELGASLVVSHPKVSMSSADEFAVVWQQFGDDGDASGILGRSFDRNGNFIKEFHVNTYTTGFQSYPSIASDPNGNFIVVWQSDGQDGDDFGVFGQRFDKSGEMVGAEFQVNSYTTGRQDWPIVAMNALGSFVVVWESPSGLFSQSSAQRFDRTGTRIGNETQLGSSPAVYEPSVTMDSTGNFVTAWTERGDYGLVIKGQEYSSSGDKRGPELQVSTSTTVLHYNPALSMDEQGNFVVVWEVARSYSEFGYNIFGRRFVCTDIDQDGICDLHDIVLTSPSSGGMLDCTAPITSAPTIRWDAGDYDRFRVRVSSTPGFSSKTVVTSGSALLTKHSYAFPVRKWRSACSKAVKLDPQNPSLFIQVSGIDRGRKPADARRKTSSQTIQVVVQR